MRFLVILIFYLQVALARNVGTTLFHQLSRKECWHEDEVAKLRARKYFEKIIPPTLTPDHVNSKYISSILKYFRTAFTLIDKHSTSHTSEIVKLALADTIGGHLRKELLPTVRYAYYAGYIPYKKARQTHDFYNEIKAYLNTQGLGWKRPDIVPQWSNLTVSKILIGTGRILDPCRNLVIKRDVHSCVHLPSPKVDDAKDPSSLALPFKWGGLLSLKNPSSDNIILKYYSTASRCILHTSPEHCRHTDFVAFNNDLWHWMKRDVAPHLSDEQLYSAYKGILRVAAAVQNYGKGLHRRNLFDDHTYRPIFWYPWGTMKDTYLFLDTCSASTVSIVIAIFIALLITLLHVMYRFFWHRKCRCVGSNDKDDDRNQKNENVQTSPSVGKSNEQTASYAKITPRFTHQLNVHCIEERKRSKLSPKSKTTSVGSTKTQKVYDLNENTEKIMSIIVSDNEDSLDISDSDEGVETNRIKTDRSHRSRLSNQTKRERSPPQLETPVAQLKIDKQSNRLKPKYSESTMTERTFLGKQASDTPWSGSGTSVTSSSGQSVSSTSSKYRTKRSSRSSRDLAWARRVLSKSFLQDDKNSTNPDLDAATFKTPPSHRGSRRK